VFYQNSKGESLLKTGRLVILTALCGALIPGYAIAQALEEIVVTARKRSESLQEIPESITSLSSFELEMANIDQINDIGGRIPNLTLTTRADGYPNVTIRGVGSFGNTQGVGFFVDGVQVVTDASSRFGDIERMEVLKGPQGTLYGGSNVGGAIKFITKRPDLEKKVGNLTVTLGEQDTRNFSGTVGMPLIEDKLAIRIFGYHEEDDGFLKASDPTRLNGEDSTSIPLPGGGTTDRFWPSTAACAAPFGPFVPNCMIPDIAEKWRSRPNEREENGVRVSVLGNITDTIELFGSVRYNEWDVGNNNWRVEEPNNMTYSRERELTFAGRHTRETYAGSWELNWDAGPVTVTYLGSYTDTESYRTTDLDVTSEVGFDLYRPELTEFMTHELRVTSNNEGSLEWIVGAFNSKKENDWDSFANFYDATSVLTGAPFGPGGAILTPGPLAILDTVLGDLSVPPTLAQELGVRIYFPFENRYREIEHIGAFVSLNYTFLEHWELGLGLRADYWSSDTLDRNAGLYGTGVPYLDQSDTEFLPKISLSYTFDNANMAYFTFAKGYEPGGYNLYDPFGTPLLNAFSEEEASSYELGVKTSLLDGTLAVNVAGFYIDYKDRQFEIQQQIAIGGIVENILNAGDSTQYGMEFDFRWMVGEHLTVTGGAGWVDAEFKEGSSVINVNSVRTPLGNDNFPPWINKYSYTLSGQYERPISNNMTVTGRLDWLGKGPFWFNMENTARNPGWDVVNARIAIAIGKIWTLGFNVENIFDEDYYVDGSVWPGDAVPGTPAPNFDPVIGTLGQPRRLTVDLRASLW
jgi:iron complex outermembrane receptor protein